MASSWYAWGCIIALVAFYYPSKSEYDSGDTSARACTFTVNPSLPYPIIIEPNQTLVRIGQSGEWNTLQESAPSQQWELAWSSVSMPEGTWSPPSGSDQGTFTDQLGLQHWFNDEVYWSARSFEYVDPSSVSHQVRLLPGTFRFDQSPRETRYKGSFNIVAVSQLVASFFSDASAYAGGDKGEYQAISPSWDPLTDTAVLSYGNKWTFYSARLFDEWEATGALPAPGAVGMRLRLSANIATCPTSDGNPATSETECYLNGVDTYKRYPNGSPGCTSTICKQWQTMKNVNERMITVTGDTVGFAVPPVGRLVRVISWSSPDPSLWNPSSPSTPDIDDLFVHAEFFR